jgi:Family of unknown function (DUF6200)
MATVTTGPDIDTLAGTIPSIRPAAPIVLDLGKHRRKTVKQLRKGTGKLIDEVSAALDELRSSGAIAPGAQPVIIVVQQKKRKNRGFLPGF